MAGPTQADTATMFAEKPSPAANPKNAVNSVAKAFAVLEIFSANRQTATISEVAKATGLGRGTAYRFIHTLVALGYLRAIGARRFGLSVKCLELGFNALISQDLSAEAQPMLAECVPSLCDAASLGTLEGADVLYLARAEQGLNRHHIDRKPGRRVRAYGSALGHAMLACLPEPEQIRILNSTERVPLSERTLTGLDALIERLRQVCNQGYAVSDGENAFGLRTVAVAIRDGSGHPVAGVSFTVDATRMTVDELIANGLPQVKRLALELERSARIRSQL